MWLELPHESMINLLVSWAAFVRARSNDELFINGWNARVRFKCNILELVTFNRIARFHDKGRLLLMWSLFGVNSIPNSVQTGHLDSVSVYKESQIRARLEEWSHGTLESVEVSSLPPCHFSIKVSGQIDHRDLGLEVSHAVSQSLVPQWIASLLNLVPLYLLLLLYFSLTYPGASRQWRRSTQFTNLVEVCTPHITLNRLSCRTFKLQIKRPQKPWAANGGHF